MPIFLDLHKASDYDAKPTVDEIKKNHIADLAVQQKYGVRFIQYWINEEEGLVFCMMEAPDKEACAAVHGEAHGGMPCNVIELKGGDYKTFMGDDNKANEFDIVEKPDGTLDNGCRILMAVDIVASGDSTLYYRKVKELLGKFHGRESDQQGDRLIAIFNSGERAINCASEILNEFSKYQEAEIQIGINNGHPLTENEIFFEVALKLTNRLCDIAGDGKALISSNIGNTFIDSSNRNLIRPLNPQEEKLLNRLLDTIEAAIGDADFNIEDIGRSIGMSRAQTYRKIIALTGKSPNNFLKELRLKRAFQLVKRKHGNISEVAYESGFSNPSYFSTVFQKRFGMLPSQFQNSNA